STPDPGQNAEIQARNLARQKVATEPVTIAGAPGEEEEKKKEKTWFEFQVLDASGAAVKSEPVKVTLKSGKVVNAKTDSKGVVRVENVEPEDVASAELTDRKDAEVEVLGEGEQREVAPPATPPPEPTAAG